MIDVGTIEAQPFASNAHLRGLKKCKLFRQFQIQLRPLPLKLVILFLLHERLYPAFLGGGAAQDVICLVVDAVEAILVSFDAACPVVLRDRQQECVVVGAIFKIALEKLPNFLALRAYVA